MPKFLLAVFVLLASVACANSPTPTPLPPVIGFMLGTPFPTDTPIPPTRTPDAASIANARATIVALNQALPTPASTPTPTPRPTYRNRNSGIAVGTLAPSPTPAPWAQHQPRPYYSIETPPSWWVWLDEESLVGIKEPRDRASVTIADYYSPTGWEGLRAIDIVKEDLSMSATPGFELLDLREIGPDAWSKFRLPADGTGCALTGHSKHVLAGTRYLVAIVEVCEGTESRYDQRFVSKMLNSFGLGPE